MFGRVVEVSIGESGEEAKLIKDLTINFSIQKTSTSKDPNTASINIWNLNENSRAFLNTPNLTISVKAGYIDEEPNIIYIGDVSSSSSQKEKTDRITTIVSRDGDKNLIESVSSVSYKDNISIKDILKDAVKKLGLGLKSNLDSILGSSKTKNNFSFTGLTKDLIEKIALRTGLIWSVQNNEVKFYKENSSDGKIVLLRPDTGLLKAPVRINVKIGKTEYPGWRIESLLLPSIEPGNEIVIDSKEIKNTAFTVSKVEHVGDNKVGPFTTTCEVFE